MPRWHHKWLLITGVVLATLFIPLGTPAKHDRSWCDSNTGSIKREHVSLFGRSGGEIIDQ